MICLKDDKGRTHCEDGPAVIFSSGRKDWFIHGDRHRNDGPAIEQNDQHDIDVYYLHGYRFYDNKSEWEWCVKHINDLSFEKSRASGLGISSTIPQKIIFHKPELEMEYLLKFG